MCKLKKVLIVDSIISVSHNVKTVTNGILVVANIRSGIRIIPTTAPNNVVDKKRLIKIFHVAQMTEFKHTVPVIMDINFTKRHLLPILYMLQHIFCK